MATETMISVLENNDRVLHVTLTSSAEGFTLDGHQAEFYVKKFKSDEDTEAFITKKTEGDAGVTITDAAALTLDINIDAIDTVGHTGMGVWRLDITDGTDRETAMFGRFEVVDT